MKKNLMLLSLLATITLIACSKQDISVQTPQGLTPKSKVVLRSPNSDDSLIIVKRNGKYYLSDDMILTEEQLEKLRKKIEQPNLFFREQLLEAKSANSARKRLPFESSRTFTSDIVKLWPNKTVYYHVNSSIPVNNAISTAIYYLELDTGLDFVESNLVPNYIEIAYAPDENSSYVGMKGGMQILLLANYNSIGKITHELGHAIGLIHEQCRSDRDEYIDINYANIDDDNEYNFNIYSGLSGLEIGSFDYNSKMLYESTEFAINPAIPVITSKTSSPISPSLVFLSAGDVETINYMYNPIYIEGEFYYTDNSAGIEWYNVEGYTEYKFYDSETSTAPITLPYDLRIKVTYDYMNQYPVAITGERMETIVTGTSSYILQYSDYEATDYGSIQYKYYNYEAITSCVGYVLR